MKGKTVIDYYNGYDEENRLIKDNAHRVEFDSTLHALEPYINEHSRILDIGAGTGRYSIHYALKGSSVHAMDLVVQHVVAIQNKIEKLDPLNKLKITAQQGDATDLSRFSNESFDIVLCMGPIYHITSVEDRLRCILECKRVLKSKGVLVMAYINDSTHREFGNNPCFIGLSPDYMVDALENVGLSIKEHVATDGVTPKISKFINGLDEKGYKDWLNFHISTYKADAAISNTLHALIIAEKG